MPAATVIDNTITLADCNIKINGRDIKSITLNTDGRSSDASQDLLWVEVQQSLRLPSAFAFQLHSPDLGWFDATTLDIGSEVEILMGYENKLTTVLKGEITALDIDAAPDGNPAITIRGYDKLHRLQGGRVTRTFAQVSDSDLVSKIAKEGGLSAGAESTNPKYQFVAQNQETNLEFLQRRAWHVGMELYADGNSLKMRKPDQNSEAGTVKWGLDLTRFNVRASAAEQVSEVTVRGWDVKTKKEIVGQASTPNAHPKVGLGKSGKQLAASFGTKKYAVARNAADQTEAQNMAQAILDDLDGRAYTMEGESFGNTSFKPGKWLKVEGVSTRFSGKYYLTSCLHRYDQRGYFTEFEASGTRANTLLELAGGSSDNRPTGPANGLIVGIVSNVKATETEGAVKVKFPTLPLNEGKEIESNWARLVSPMAGKDRGFYCLPEVNDEVLVGFENGDINRPYVLGSLWNGKDAPPLKSSAALDGQGRVNQRVFKTRAGHTVTFDDADASPLISIVDKTGKNKITLDSKLNTITIESDKDINIKAPKGKLLLEAKDIELKATASVKASGAQVEIEGKSSAEFKSNATTKISGATFDIAGQGSGSINGGGKLDVKGGIINLN